MQYYLLFKNMCWRVMLNRESNNDGLKTVCNSYQLDVIKKN